MITEMFIEGRRVDISADISSLLTFAIDDIKDFASRQTAFSKTIVLPGTNNNNQLFGSIFETGISNDYNSLAANILSNFNASKSARCLVFQDNLQTFKGTLRLLQINKDRHNIEYETALNGELTNLNVALSSKLLSNLDFSAYNTTYNQVTITNSWTATPGSGVYYPLIDYGQLSFYKHDWDIRAFRPALYVREYIDKMFTAAGYRFKCALFDTMRFKRLVVPHNKKLLTSYSDLLLNEVGSYGFGSPQTVLYSGTALSGRFAFNIFSGGSFTPDASPAMKATYNVAGPTSVLLVWNLSIQYFSDFATTFSIKKNGVDVYAQTLPSTGMATTYISLTNTTGIPISLSNTDYLEVWMTGPFGHNYTINFTGGQFTVKTATPGSVPIVIGNTIVINDSIPANIRQIDFLSSIVKLFNLYVYEDKFDDRLILITPFPDFYSTNSSNAVDWTYKLNRDAPIKIKPLSELNSKIYNFNYKDDSDYWNELYKKRYNQAYGSYIFDSQFEFVSQTNKLELIFAATPLVGYPGEEKVVSSIYKSNNNVEENLDSVIRILQSKLVTGVASWDMLDGPGTHLTTRTDYGYAGHLDDPNNPTNDLNFGALKELFFILVTGDLTKTQFNIYWSTYMAEITDKDSKMVTAKFYLTPKDIFDLDFSKYIMVDSVLYRLNKITDYNASQPSDCECELLKVINTIY